MNKTTEHKFAVGDRVIYRPKRTGNGWLAGEHGTVIYVDNTEAAYTVEFDNPIGEGATDYRTRDNGIEPKPWHGWFCKEENLEAENEKPH
jgi:hypothetical protein